MNQTQLLERKWIQKKMRRLREKESEKVMEVREDEQELPTVPMTALALCPCAVQNKLKLIKFKQCRRNDHRDIVYILW